MPTIDLPDDELAAAAAAIRGLIEGDRYPHAPRLDPLRAALARFDAATKERQGERTDLQPKANIPADRRESRRREASEQAPPPAKADKRARR